MLIISLLFHLPCMGQNTIATSLSYTKTDYFHGIEYGRSIQSFSVFAGFEYGIVRSLFQSRFFPKVKAGFSYSIIDKEKFKLGPVIQYSYSHLQYSKVPKGSVSYHELNGGVRWRYGRTWQIGQTLCIGGLWERGMNTIYQKTMTHGTLGYVVQIECVYAF